MEIFYKDTEQNDIAKTYVGKTMDEITKLEQERFDKNRPKIDAAHKLWLKTRKDMLTVRKLIEWLQTQDLDACVLAYEQNSDAYIEQFPSLPSPDVLNVADAKKMMREDLKSWYKDTEDADAKIERDVSTVFRYAQDNDVIIRFS